jgi:hypothetical protein
MKLARPPAGKASPSQLQGGNCSWRAASAGSPIRILEWGPLPDRTHRQIRMLHLDDVGSSVPARDASNTESMNCRTKFVILHGESIRRLG